MLSLILLAMACRTLLCGTAVYRAGPGEAPAGPDAGADEAASPASRPASAGVVAPRTLLAVRIACSTSRRIIRPLGPVPATTSRSSSPSRASRRASGLTKIRLVSCGGAIGGPGPSSVAPVVAGSVLAGTALAGTVLAGTVLAGTVLARAVVAGTVRALAAASAATAAATAPGADA